MSDNTNKPKARPTKTPKGTRDFGPFQMSIREKVINTIGNCFKRHGAVAIDTPVFELKEVLLGNYGEDSKLIYDLADQGGEELALRYDLTVPFARYLAANGIENMKRYHIAKVYRRDNPAITKGRYREFYQCDYDIAGKYDLMLPDAECLKVLSEILDELNVGSYVVKLNHRKILDGIFAFCGVPEPSFRTISSAVDKLDKVPWEEVKKEMIELKGLKEEVADKIGTFVRLSGNPMKIVDQLKAMKITNINDPLMEMEALFQYLKIFGILEKVNFDLSLARGLDYYTGMVLEAVLTDESKVGSIAGGGRYDNLVDAFLPGTIIPAVGFSVGIERIFAIMEERSEQERISSADVLVATIGSNLLQQRLSLCCSMWKNGIKAEFLYFVDPKLRKQLDHANANKIPWVVVIGEDELKEGVVKVKNMSSSEETKVKLDEISSFLKQQLNK